jgi:hypothetical protein
VFIPGRRQKKLDEVVTAIGRNATGVQGDVAKLADLDRLYQTVSKVKGRFEGLNSALPLRFYGLQYGLLDELNSPVVALYYQRMSVSVSIRQQILGLSGLIRSGSGTALLTAIQASSSFGSYTMENGILQQSVRDNFRSADANSVAILKTGCGRYHEPKFRFSGGRSTCPGCDSYCSVPALFGNPS